MNPVQSFAVNIVMCNIALLKLIDAIQEKYSLVHFQSLKKNYFVHLKKVFIYIHFFLSHFLFSSLST